MTTPKKPTARKPSRATAARKPVPAHKEPTKKRGSQSASIANNTCEPGEIRKILSNTLYWYDREIVRSDEECAERLNEYFTRVIENNEIPTLEKMCLVWGTTRNTVWEWEQGSLGTARSNMIKKAKDIAASLDAELVSKGKIPVISYIFRAKNFFGMKDNQEMTLVNGSPMGDEVSPDDIRKRLSAPKSDENSDETD